MFKSALSSLLGLMLIGILSPKASIAAEYEELRYEDLVQQLSEKRDNPYKKSAPGQVMLHAGFGIVSSSNQVRYPTEVRSRPMTGFQLSAGVDLFSEDWMGEFVFRNFANHNSGSETRALRETAWRVVNRKKVSSTVETRFGVGFAERQLTVNDSTSEYSFSQNTPAGLLSIGFDTVTSKHSSLGIEAGVRSALATRTNDVNAFDITMRMEGRF